MNNALKTQIKELLTSSLVRYIKKFSYTHSQPLDLLIPEERKIRSLVGGLETSMGTTIWEPIAKLIASNNYFEIINEKILKPEPFPQEISSCLSRLISNRENKDTWISIGECVRELRNVSNRLKRPTNFIAPPAGTGVDLYFKKNNTEYAFDIKTVQPNLGTTKSFNKQILEWYAYRLYANPTVEIQCKIAYPYNPFADVFWNHTPHTKHILEPKVDAVVENEFWDFLSGENNTYQQITSIFLELQREGFGKKLSQLIKN